MTVLECGDATEVESVLDVAQAIEGPVYVRMLRGEVPRLFDPADPMRFQTARVLRRGSDVTVLSSGICTEEALRAIGPIAGRGVSVRHLHVSTLKPFADPAAVDALASARLGVVTMENHNTIGGLGSAVAEVMAEAGMARRLVRLGINDQYSHGASRAYLMRECGLDASALVGAVEQLAGETLGIGEEDLAARPAGPVQTTAKPEDL
jgi:transketolase